MDDILNKIENQRLKDRAEKIREHCERILPRIHSQGLFRYYNDHGPAHSKAVLKLLNNLLDDISLKKDNGRLTEYEYFILYAAAWCHDSGMLMREGEDFDNSEVCERVRETHPERTAEDLSENWSKMGIQSETEAYLLGEICKAHGGDPEKIKELPENSGNVYLRLLGALLRLADALDAREDRLPPEPYMEVPGILEKQYVEYWKHEVLDSISINHKEKKIIVQLIVKYEYPVDVVKRVKEKLTEELNSVKEVLEKYNISFNLDFPPLIDMIKYERRRNKRELLKELKLMTIDGDLIDEELQILLQEAKKKRISDKETIRLIVEFLNENNVKTVGSKEEKLPGIKKNLLTLRKEYIKAQ